MAHSELIPKWKALAVLSSDALSSVAYATEEILIPLAAFSLAAVAWTIPIAVAIVALLVIITLSYRQTITAYPSGGGAYTVAKQNLGQTAGLIAAASLLIDYILTVSVSVASGVENIVSALPILAEHKVVIGVVAIIVLMFVNLRGVRESATIFALPTYMFIFSFVILIVVGCWRMATGVVPAGPPIIHAVYPTISIFLILKAFSAGCTALTGVEAISNGVPVFQAPAATNAKTTMFWMSLILGVFFFGITALSHAYGIIPKEGETAVSLLSHAIFGSSWFYYFIQAATASILLLAANTSYADFPRLSSLLAYDRYLPRQLAILGDRLVFSNGIVGLSLAAIFLIIAFHGETHHLIPLYAIGVFLSFTLSQSGMVLHHLRLREPHWIKSLFFNALGAVTTLVVLLVITYNRFAHGAWIVIVLIPLLVMMFSRIHRHYIAVGKELSALDTTKPASLRKVQHTVIIPISGIHAGVLDALRYAISISEDVRACYVEITPAATDRMKSQWSVWAPGIPFVVLESPFRAIVQPLLEYIDDVEEITHGDMVTIVIPEFVTVKWYHQFLHNQTAFLIKTALMFRRGKVVTSVRYHLGER